MRPAPRVRALRLSCLFFGLLILTVPGPVPWASIARSTVQSVPDASRASSEGPGAGHAARAALDNAYGQLPLTFERNVGQTDAQVDFLARGRGYALFLTQDGGATFALTRGTAPEPRELRCGALPAGRGPRLEQPPMPGCDDRPAPAPAQQAVLKLSLPGATLGTRGGGEEKQAGTVNYLTGSRRQAFHTNVATYKRVRYTAAYPGIDLVYYGNQSQLEYDFVVEPGADPSAIALQFDGADALEVDAQGNLQVWVGGQRIVQKTPLIYQERVGGRDIVAGGYTVMGEGRVGFDIGPYDPGRELVIDPVLVYSTFLGGSLTGAPDEGRAIAVDAAGGIYVTGLTYAIDFPTTGGAFDTANGYYDLFVTKLAGDGSSLEYSTYLGGSGYEEGMGIAVDAAGAAYISGRTESWDFPTTTGAFDTSGGSGDAFVTKLSADGSSLVYSTYLGGSGYDFAQSIAVDAAGAAYATGYTSSSDFPATAGAFDTSNDGGYDAFVTKLSADGSSLAYSGFLGGNSSEIGYGIAVDASGAAFVTGYTYSADFPTTSGAFDTTWAANYVDVFVTKLSASGASLVYSTYLGGNSDDIGHAVAVDTAGAAYVTGYARSNDFPTTSGAFDTSNSGSYYDAFVTKLNADGGSLAYSTFIGGSSYEEGSSIAVDPTGAAYVAGRTDSSNFPTTAGAFDTIWNSTDAFVVKLNPAGSALAYGTYLGGSQHDQARAIAIDASGRAILAGFTYSGDFPTTAGAFDETWNDQSDVFVARLSAAGSALDFGTYLGGYMPGGNDLSLDIAVDSAGQAHVVGVTTSIDFPTTPGVVDPALSNANGNYDLFVTKLSADGSALVYSTYLGGSEYEYGGGIDLDPAGAAYVTGYTYSSDFPTTSGAFDTSMSGSYDGFVAKLTSDGSSLVYSSFLGGSSTDYAQDIAVDAAGLAHVTGYTYSSNFPTTVGAFDATSNGSADVFVTKVSADGSSLIYSTLLGGNSYEYSGGIDLDAAGAAYVTGYTSSINFPTTPGAFDGSLASSDAFVSKLSASGSVLEYSTFLGGTSHEEGRGIAVDADGAAYVTGQVYSTDFPITPGAFDTSNDGYYDAFVTKLSPDGASLAYSTYLGGTGYDYANGIAVDASGSAYVAGYTQSSDFPAVGDQFNTYPWGEHAFVTTLTADGSAISYSSLLGGSSTDYAEGIAVDSTGAAYVTGYTYSADYPTTSGAFDQTLNASIDAFVAKISVNTAPSVDAGGPYTVNEGGSVSVDATGSDPEDDTLTYEWDLDNDGTYETSGETVAFSAAALNAPATRTIRVRVTDTGGLTATDEATVKLTYAFTGFFGVLQNLPVANEVVAGKAVAAKFKLNGDQGLAVLAAGYPASQPITCDAFAVTDPVEETVDAATSSLSYKPETDMYQYTWKTTAAWKNTCRRLNIKLNDGTEHVLYFLFK